MNIRKNIARILMIGSLLFGSSVLACNNEENWEKGDLGKNTSSEASNQTENIPSIPAEEQSTDSVHTENIMHHPQEAISLTVQESELPKELTEDLSYFKVCKIGTMEYAIADVANYLTEKKQQGKAAVWEQYPILEPSGKLFLRRKQGEENWQGKCLDFDSTVPAWEESTPGITFADEQHGMISFGWWYTVLLVTGDGGETWEMTKTVPEPGTADHNRADCIINCGENRYLVGYRYLTMPRGSIWLTKDNGDTWEQVEIAVPETQETFCYVEPVEASYDGERVILKMRMVLEDEHGVRSESFYDTVSKDGGETWE